MNSTYKLAIYFGVFCTLENFIMQVFLSPENSNSKYHILGIAIGSVIGGIIGGVVFGVLIKWFKNRKRKQSVTK